MAKDKTPKKRSRIHSLLKWIRRISFIAGIVTAVRKYQSDQNQSKQPPRP